jgi:hypothetical protein
MISTRRVRLGVRHSNEAMPASPRKSRSIWACSLSHFGKSRYRIAHSISLPQLWIHYLLLAFCLPIYEGLGRAE